MESQFGIANVWTQGDFVTRFVALLLLGMSLASWIVIFIKALDILKFQKNARAAKNFWHSEDFAAGLNQLGGDESGSRETESFLARFKLGSDSVVWLRRLSVLRAVRLELLPLGKKKPAASSSSVSILASLSL